MMPVRLVAAAILLAAATLGTAGGRSEASPGVALPADPVLAADNPPAADAPPESAAPPLDPLRKRMTELGFELPRRSVEAIEFELADTEGALHSLSSYRGQVVFLNFWATWCVPCRTEMPAMQALHTLLGADSGFRMIAVNLQESPAQVTAFVDELQLSFDILIDDTGKTAATYGARTLPISYIIGKDGAIMARIIGIREWAEPVYTDLFVELAAAEPPI